MNDAFCEATTEFVCDCNNAEDCIHNTLDDVLTEYPSIADMPKLQQYALDEGGEVAIQTIAKHSKQFKVIN